MSRRTKKKRQRSLGDAGPRIDPGSGLPRSERPPQFSVLALERDLGATNEGPLDLSDDLQGITIGHDEIGTLPQVDAAQAVA